MTHPTPLPAERSLLRDGNFRWLLSGAVVSNLGDQFTLLALPWAVLQMTGDPLQLGLVLLLIGVPRAVFILLGGAIVDRHSPQRVLMLSKHANTVLLAVLAGSIATGGLGLPMLHALALCLGLASAFGIPAATSMLPQVVAPAQLPAANGLMMGLRQLTLFIGPLLADRMATRIDFDKKSLSKLLALSHDAVLQADLPALTVPQMEQSHELSKRYEPVRVHLAERGLLTIHDARRLPDGHYLLALGEGGVIRIDRHGRQLAQFSVPATRLVMADGGQRALALVQRDSMWRVSRIDLISRKVSDWIIQPLRFWADNYDGLIWNAVIDNRLVAIDTSRDQLAISWQVADLPGRVVAFQEEYGTQTLLLSTAENIQQWRYQLPARRLVQRDSFPYPRDTAMALLPHSTRDAPTLAYIMEDGGHSCLQVHHGGATAPLTLPLQVIASVPEVTQAAGLLLVRSHHNDDSILECLVASGRTGSILAQLLLADCETARVHVDDDHILLFDDAGRLIDIDCENSQVHTLTLA